MFTIISLRFVNHQRELKIIIHTKIWYNFPDLVQVRAVVEEIVHGLEVEALLYLSVGADQEVEKGHEEG